MEWRPADRSPGRNYHFMVSAVAPRPIAWITSGTDPVNLAPFSWFQAICADPPLVMVAFADREGSMKDTARNILADGEFVINAVTTELGQVMVDSSAPDPPEVSEAERIGIALAPSSVVAPPRVTASPFHLECELREHHRYGETEQTTVIVAEVVHIHADDDVLDARGNIDVTKAPLLGRMGGNLYVGPDHPVEIQRP